MIERFFTYTGDQWAGSSRICIGSCLSGACCTFPPERKSYFIILQPGELEFARHLGVRTSHLTVIDDDFFGGKKAICRARDKAHCDFGWKPFDCRMHPVFPYVDRYNKFFYIHDLHCSAFSHDQFGWHLADVARNLSNQFMMQPELTKFYRDCFEQGDYSPPQRFRELEYFMYKQEQRHLHS